MTGAPWRCREARVWQFPVYHIPSKTVDGKRMDMCLGRRFGLLLQWRSSKFAAGETASRLYNDKPSTERGWKRSAASTFSCFSSWFGWVFFAWWCRPPSFHDKEKNPDISAATIKMETLRLAKNLEYLFIVLSFRCACCLLPCYIIWQWPWNILWWRIRFSSTCLYNIMCSTVCRPEKNDGNIKGHNVIFEKIHRSAT